MKAIRRILVAVKDPDAKQLPAVEKAVQLARASGASIELFHAIAEPVYADFELTDESLQDLKASRAARYWSRLERIAIRLRRQNLNVRSCADWDFPTYEAIVRRALAVKADLIVAECHAAKRFAPWLLHFTDWELIRTSPLPVLLVRTEYRYERPIVLAAVDPGHAHAKPSGLDPVILNEASGMAKLLSGTAHAMHAFFPGPLDVPASQIVRDARADVLYTKVEKRARAAFERCAARGHIPRARQHLVKQNPVVAIPETAKEVGADIVVMGAVSRSGLKRLFIGNTAERVLNHVHCDVLVVKPRHFAQRVARRQRGVQLVAPHFPSTF
jgi:universal stress protein E